MSLNEGRYTWRHNAVLKELAQTIQPRLNNSQSLYCDLEGYRNTAGIFHSYRPDIVVESDDCYHALELTCPHELNVSQAHEYKVNKYRNLVAVNGKRVKITAIEITNLGFFNCVNFDKFCKETCINVEAFCFRRLCEMALRSSYFIFCNRHRAWPNPGPTYPVF